MIVIEERVRGRWRPLTIYYDGEHVAQTFISLSELKLKAKALDLDSLLEGGCRITQYARKRVFRRGRR